MASPSQAGVSAQPPAAEEGITICIPVFNDWIAVFLLVEQIDVVAKRLGILVSVLIVDDGSSEPPPPCLPTPPKALKTVEVLQLRRNLGHQRAITIGLTFIHVNRPCKYVVVMDADGEDLPSDLEALIDCCRKNHSQRIVFAKRAKRSEGVVFRVGYITYKVIHLILTGRRVEVGNYSVIPFHMLEHLVAISELWNHYAAAAFHARLPLEMLPLARGQRLHGQSKMNLISLVTHGMSAISVYCDTVGVRLMCATVVLILLALGGLFLAVGIRVFTDLAIPGWATATAGILALMLLNLFTLMIVFVLFVLQSRSTTGFLPMRDWHYFVARHWRLDE